MSPAENNFPAFNRRGHTLIKRLHDRDRRPRWDLKANRSRLTLYPFFFPDIIWLSSLMLHLQRRTRYNCICGGESRFRLLRRVRIIILRVRLCDCFRRKVTMVTHVYTFKMSGKKRQVDENANYLCFSFRTRLNEFLSLLKYFILIRNYYRRFGKTHVNEKWKYDSGWNRGEFMSEASYRDKATYILCNSELVSWMQYIIVRFLCCNWGDT